MTDKLILTTELAERLKTHLAGAIDEVDEADELYKLLQSLPMVSEPENKDVVELYGMKNGIQVHLGQAPTPPRMKAKEIVEGVFGRFDEHDDMDDGDAALCFSCMTELIDYMQKLSKPSPQALTQVTAEDITPAMHQEWNKIFGGNDMSIATPSDGAIMAAAYNAVIRHRSEA